MDRPTNTPRARCLYRQRTPQSWSESAPCTLQTIFRRPIRGMIQFTVILRILLGSIHSYHWSSNMHLVLLQGQVTSNVMGMEPRVAHLGGPTLRPDGPPV